MDASDVVGVWAKIYQYQLASHGMGAATSLAMSGIDMALWYIRGKACGWPLYKLLGGRSKPIRAYAGGVALGYQPPVQLIDEAAPHVAAGYKALKSILDGSVAAASDNVLIYATSNRRHLLPEYMAENLTYQHLENGEVHPGEVVEEKISLSERFGLWVSFYPFTQDEYLAIVAQWLRGFGVGESAIEAARPESLVWALERGSRSGRQRTNVLPCRKRPSCSCPKVTSATRSMRSGTQLWSLPALHRLVPPGMRCAASPSCGCCPVSISLPLPGVRLASIKRMSPPTGVQASPVATPGRLGRSAISLSYLAAPRMSLPFSAWGIDFC